ncbi:MAG: transcription termination/antitermination protein NusG [Pirellulaceae bacterium]
MKGLISVDGEEKTEREENQDAVAPSDAEARSDDDVQSEASVVEELASGEAVGSSESQASDEDASSEPEDGSELEPSKPRKIRKPAVEEEEAILDPDEAPKDWYILKVAFNREETVRDAIIKQIKMSGLDGYFGEVLVPTEDIVEFTRAGKRKIVKRKLYPGYLMIYMHVNDDTWFLIRDTTGVSDFTGTAGKPAPMDPAEVERVIKIDEPGEDGEKQLKTSIPFKVGERVRVKEGNFQNQEGEVEKLDEANGRISVNINIFGRSVPVELDHWQVEPL